LILKECLIRYPVPVIYYCPGCERGEPRTRVIKDANIRYRESASKATIASAREDDALKKAYVMK